tara:strand:- start:56 stop:424 length:369 start_codon:yes stop_codon:yes gene_type:complete
MTALGEYLYMSYSAFESEVLLLAVGLGLGARADEREEGLYQQISGREIPQAAPPLEQGAAVGICGKNCVEWVVADAACLAGGWISVPLQTRLAPSTLQKIIHSTNMQCLVTGKCWKVVLLKG